MKPTPETIAWLREQAKKQTDHRSLERDILMEFLDHVAALPEEALGKCTHCWRGDLHRVDGQHCPVCKETTEI